MSTLIKTQLWKSVEICGYKPRLKCGRFSPLFSRSKTSINSNQPEKQHPIAGVFHR